ncbi:MAG: hypothetical protein O3A85_02325 [Proteobacteria bacterium]|nr:hypothetical protein [Pseudomonadota bacterium]
MNTISESATSWRPSVELAVVPEARTPRPVVPEARTPRAIGSEGGIKDDDFKIFGEDGFTFTDFLDIINPLQHIPIIATLYREMSGDDLDPGSRVVGGSLFMGPIGTVAALANVMIDDTTGKDMGQHVMTFFNDGASTLPEVSDTGTGPVAMSTDPVTAWAMAEASYRTSVAGKTAATEPSPIATTALSETIDVANWAMAEASYRKSAATSTVTPSPVSQPAHQSELRPAPMATPLAEAPAKATVRGRSALAALRQDLQAGAVPQAAQAAPISGAKAAMAESRQGATSLAAASFNGVRQGASEGRSPASQPAIPPAGAIAAEGGWFSGTMLSALSKYDNGAALARAALPGIEKPNSIDLAR